MNFTSRAVVFGGPSKESQFFNSLWSHIYDFTMFTQHVLNY